MATQPVPAKYPSGGEYVDALQHPSLAFSDPQLRQGLVRLDALGMPEPISGNFASVFAVTGNDGNSWAIKCFVRPDPDRQRRYAAIASALKALNHPALVDFDYQTDGVMVAGRRYPLLKMHWVEAQGLMTWLESHRSQPSHLLAIAGQLVDVISSLERARIAHGDLQHGNLLITPSNELKLIDYDGMYVPQLKGLPPNEKGLANYQHPARNDQDYGQGLDRFSAWSIYTSLIALASRPELWRDLRDSDDDTKLLFDAADYRQASASPAFTALRTSGNPQLSALAEKLAAFSQLPLANVPALTAVDDTIRLAAPAAPPAATSVTSSAPDWLTDHLAPDQRSPTAQAAATGPRLPQFTGSYLRVARAAAAVGLLSIVGLVLVVIKLPILAEIPMGTWVAAALASLAALVGSYRAHPVVHERRRATARWVAAETAAVQAQATFDELWQQTGYTDMELERQKQAITAKRDAATRACLASTSTAQQVLQTSLAKIQRERSNTSNSQHTREKQRLEKIVAEHVTRTLQNAVITRNPPPGISSGVAANLARSGFRTAADFVTFRTVSGNGRYDTIYLQRSISDRGTHVENVGTKRAKSLMDWRDTLITMAQKKAPKQLTSAQRRDVANELLRFTKQLDQQETQAKKELRDAVDLAKQKEKAQQTTLDNELARAENASHDRRRNFDRRLTGARSDATARQQEAEQARLVNLAYADATGPRFLRATFGL